ncbi:hypothetical protein [Prauserella flavalba]|uniref:Uncharacterized protein n=1 Tax=Prauserella flavalba TaxID=1477506 RepID=A0A318LIY3_9PSEU|nr:hypothetical protein [Prauserella flavalba]PXY30653.1 hypothetical protein BA062_19090 [Prauserella flavalba]
MPGRDPIVNPLQASVHRKLDDITRSVSAGTGSSRQQNALLVAALRSVLSEHRPDATGHCTVCHGRRSRFLARRRGTLPCRAYLAAHLALGPDIEEATSKAPDPARHHRRGRPPLHVAS